MSDESEEGKQNKEATRRLERGNHYAQNNQWDSAVAEFAIALDRLYTPFFLSKPDAPRALGDLLAALDEIRSERHQPASAPIEDLDEDERQGLRTRILALCAEGPERDQVLGELKARPAVAIFPFMRSQMLNRDLPLWTIVFHEEKSMRYGDLDVSFPTGSSCVFVASQGRFQRLSPRQVARLSYAWAHLAQATMECTVAMYLVHQVLLDRAIPAIDLRLHAFRKALLLDPTHAWTLAHIGEVHRKKGNSFHGDGKAYQGEDDRLHAYVTAMIYLQEAIDVADATGAPESFWAYAHLGAAIVNTRGFVGYNNEPAEPPALGDLRREWLARWPDAASDDLNLVWTNWALSALIRAQELQGFYYPWGQIYYSAALLIKAAFTQDQHIASLGQLHGSLGYYLEPPLLDKVFEPQQLSVNPLFEIAEIQRFRGNYALAWQYAWMGMKWLFKYRFQPGLYGLSGCNLLVKIASDYMASHREATAEEKSALLGPGMLGEARGLARSAHVDQEMGRLQDFRDLEISREIIGAPQELFKLILMAHATYIVPNVDFLLGPAVALNDNITAGLTTTLLILDHFLRVVEQHPPVAEDAGGTLLRGWCKRLLEPWRRDIATKLSMSPGQLVEPREHPAGGQHKALFSWVSATPDYYMLKELPGLVEEYAAASAGTPEASP